MRGSAGKGILPTKTKINATAASPGPLGAMGAAQRRSATKQTPKIASVTLEVDWKMSWQPKAGAVGIVVVILVIFLLGIRPRDEPVSPIIRHRYGLMIDAGSSGSRIHIFRFAEHADGMLDLENETFKKLEPGLSAYAADPPAAAASLQPLIDTALAAVPPHQRACSPLSLYATAGLRLIGHDRAEDILVEVRRLFRASGFAVLSDDAVTVIEGSREGLYGWMSVNYLLKKWPIGPISTTAAVIDLGGASTQIVFRPHGPPDEVDALLRIGGGNYTARVDYRVTGQARHGLVYQYSHLGYGLNEMNRRLMESGRADCHGFAECEAAFVAILEESSGGMCRYEAGCSADGVFMPRLGKYFADGRVYALSFVYDRLSSWFEEGGEAVMPLSRIRDIGTNVVCVDDPSVYVSNVSGGNKQHCMDLAYIYVMLTDMYGLSPFSEVVLIKKVRGYETAWALGAAMADAHAHPQVGVCAGGSGGGGTSLPE